MDMTASTMLPLGSTVQLQYSQTICQVECLIGAGGQGEVYRVRTREPDGERVHALKWYFPMWATQDQWENLQSLVQLDPPSSQFLWPADLAFTENRSFGYLMPLRGENFHGIVDLMLQTISPSFRALATSAFQLADSFLQLHSAGLCYRDINWGNVFLNPDSGEVLICDNDNVGIDGQAVIGVLGTEKFMAPEVVRREVLPSTTTDLYSLSVLLFYLFMVHHPLEGRHEMDGTLTDRAADHRLYGTDPVFIWDPDDDSNRPVPGIHDNALIYWGIYPRFLRELFVRAFTQGLRDPQNGRVRETEWRNAAARLRDAIYYCSSCRAENFWDESLGSAPPCWRCHAPTVAPPRFVGKRGVVMLNRDAELFPHHLSGSRGDFSAPVAAVVQHPSMANVWGLRNLSQRT